MCAAALAAFAPRAAAQPLAYVLLQVDSDAGAQRLTVIDTVTRTRLATIPLETACAGCSLPRGLAVTPDGSRVFAANKVSGTVSVIDALTRTIVGSLPLGPAAVGPPSLAMAPDGSRLYVLNGNTLRVFDTHTLTPVRTLPIKTGTLTTDLLLSPDGGRFYVMDLSYQRVAVVDPSSGAVLNSLPLPTGSPQFTLHAMELTGDGSTLYVTGTVNGRTMATVSVFNTATAQLVTTFNAPGWRPRVSPDDSRLWLAGDGGIALVDRQSHTYLGTITTPGDVFNVTMDFTPDGSTAFVSSLRAVMAVDAISHTIDRIAVDPPNEGFSQTIVIAPPPPPPPDPPTNLIVRSIIGSNVTFEWRAPAGGSTPTGYHLEGGVAPGDALVTIPIGSTNTIFTVTAPPGSYYVRVRTVSGRKQSDPSNEVALHLNLAVPPSAPAGLTGLVNGSSIWLTWRNTFAGGRPEAALLDVTGAVATTIPLGAGESFSYANVPPGTYTLSIRTRNAGGASPPSNAVTLSFPGPCTGVPAAPANFVAYRAGSTITLVWDPAATGPATMGYVVTVTGSFTGTFAVASRTIGGTVGRGSYGLSVAGTNACGQGPATPAQVIVVP
jgi:YVTN family beta-propeller protein